MMTTSLHLYCALFLLYIYRAATAPISPSNKSDDECTPAQLIAADQGTLIYEYKTEVLLSVANNQFDLKTEVTASVEIKNLGSCNYAFQLRNVKVAETKDEADQSVTSTENAQRELENLVVRFRWIDGFVVALEADSSVKIDHINFVKGVLSALQIYSPKSTDDTLVIREEDVLGVCTTAYKYIQKDDVTQIKKTKDLSTCSRDKLHLSSSSVLTSLLGPILEEMFTAKTSYACQTDIRDRKIQSVKCKTVETTAAADDISEVNFNVDFNNDNEEITSKLISIKQELKLQSSSSVSIDENAITNPIRQTLQFIPTASFDQSNEAVSKLVTKIQALLKTADWTEFAAAQFVDITNELRRMDKTNVQEFKTKSELKHLIPAFLNTVYGHDPVSSLLNFDLETLTFSNPSSVYYLENPSTELVNLIVQGAQKLSSEQVPNFVGLASKILQAYKTRQHYNENADVKIKEFHQAISKFLENSTDSETHITAAVLSAYAQLGLYDQNLEKLFTSDETSLEIQYHVLNAISHINLNNLDFSERLSFNYKIIYRLISKLEEKSNKNAVRIWAFQALFSLFANNPTAPSYGLIRLETELQYILEEPLNQVNGFIWSTLKYVSLDIFHSLNELSSRLRINCKNSQQYLEQAALSSRQIQFEIPIRKDYRTLVDISIIFENDRVVPSFISAKLALNGIRRETVRLPWIDAAMIIENLDWNFADYFLRLDPLNKNLNEDEKTRLKNKLPRRLKDIQDTYDSKEEDPDPSVRLHLKLFGTDVRIKDVTDQVKDILRNDLRQFIGKQILNRLNQLAGHDPIFRIPFEIGSASAAANGLTLYRSAQVSILADLTTDVRITMDGSGQGVYSMTSRSALSFALTLQREVSSPLTTVGETVQLGILSYVPFEYKIEANSQGRTREFNILKPNAKLLAIDFQYGTRTSAGFEIWQNRKTASIDPSCTPSALYRTLGARVCLELNPFRSMQFGSRAIYPITISVNRDPAIKNWRLGWRFNAQEAPQYELAVAKVGVTDSYPGLGVSVTMTGNKFDCKFLTGMKFFNVNGTKTDETFSGSVYSNEDKEIMTTSGTLSINNDGFKLQSQFFDVSSKKEVLTLATNILPNRGQGLTADFSLTTPDKTKSFKLQFRGDLYNSNSKLIHLSGGFNLGQTTYNGKLIFERDANHTRIEIQRLFKLGQDSSSAGYELFYEYKTSKETTQTNHNIVSHISLRTPTRDESMKVFNFKTDFTRTIDLSNTTLQSSIDYLLLTRNPPVQETISFDYIRRLVRTNNTARRLTSPETNFKVQIKTKSNVLNFLVDHRHRKSSEASKKGPLMLPPTLDINNKIHIVVDTDKLYPDMPHQFSFDILSDLDFQLLNEVNYKFEYNLPRRQHSGLFKYHGQVDKLTHGHIFSGTSQSELQWDNKQKQATATGTFDICLRSNTVKSHWDIDTNIIEDKNDVTLDLNLRFDRQPKKDSVKSLIASYDIKLKAPKHKLFQLIDIDGNFTRQNHKFQTFNSIAVRMNERLKEINVNAFCYNNITSQSIQHAHISFSLPFKNLPYVTYDLKLKNILSDEDDKFIESRLIAKPIFSHYYMMKSVPLSEGSYMPVPLISVHNEFEYLFANGDSLYGVSKIETLLMKSFHSFASLKKNTDLLHKHSIGVLSTSKTNKIALSLISPQISTNAFSIIGEYTRDRKNLIGKMKLPQEFGIHLEFSTPLTNLTAFRVYYNLPLLNIDHSSTLDGSVGFKIALPNLAPISYNLHSKGSLETTLKLVESLRIGHDMAVHTSLTAQYNPQLTSQLSISSSSKFYGQEYQHSFYALVKQHKVIVRGILNTSYDQGYRYEMDIGYDDDLLTGHTERTDGKETTVSDIDSRKCTPTDKYQRCYKGDITIRAGTNGGSESKGTFDISWGRDTAKLDIKVPNHIEFSFDHTHTGRIVDDDFSSKTNMEGKLLQPKKQGGFRYSSSYEKEDGKWNDVQIQSSLNDMQTGQKSLVADIRLNQKITDKRTGQFQRKFNVNLESKSVSLLQWSSDSFSCSNNPSNVVYGICQTATFNVKANNLLVQSARKHFQLPIDVRLSDPLGHVTYDGTVNLDLKYDPNSGPHTVKFDLNRLREDAIDFDLSYQPRIEQKPMNLSLKLSLPQQNPISIQYDETLRSQTNFTGTLKYSFNANDSTTEKTYQCECNYRDTDDFEFSCKGERTALSAALNVPALKVKFLLDLNRFTGQRIGFERENSGFRSFNMTLYTFFTSWNIRYDRYNGNALSVKQKGQEVFGIDETKLDHKNSIITFSPSNIKINATFDDSKGEINIVQIYPQQRDLLKIKVDGVRIESYMQSLIHLNGSLYDVDDTSPKSNTPLFIIALDSHVLFSVSQALSKIGSYHGIYGLSTIKKLFKLQIGDANLTMYNVQHWKNYVNNLKLPETYSIRIVNEANGNSVQLATNKWNENRLISTISHSFDGGKTQTTDLKINRAYALQVGSIYFFHSLGYRNIQGFRQLKNSTRQFIRDRLGKDFNETNLAELIRLYQKRMRSIIETDYAALKEIVDQWSKESEDSFFRKLNTRFGLHEFFDKYQTYSEAMDRMIAVLCENAVRREEFWRKRLEAILNENRLVDLSKRIQAGRQEIMKYLLGVSEKMFDRVLPKFDQKNINERIVNFVQKSVASFEQIAKQNAGQWKVIFKAIDDASKGDENKWFRTLIADIDSNAIATVADAELTKVLKKLSGSSILLISNIQTFSQKINKRRESIRERVQNIIQHFPKVSINDTNFEILIPKGRQPGSYSYTNKLLLNFGAVGPRRSGKLQEKAYSIANHFQSHKEKLYNYLKTMRSLVKRLFKRNPSPTPEFNAVIAHTGDAIDFHGDYIYLNTSCDYVLAHDFGGLQFSFRFIFGKVYSVLPNLVEIKENECSNTGRVQLCNRGYYSTINVPMHYGGLVDGAFGDVRDRSGNKHRSFSRWLALDCSAAEHYQVKETVPSVLECANINEDKQEFCENFVQRGIKSGLDRRQLVIQAIGALKDAL